MSDSGRRTPRTVAANAKGDQGLKHAETLEKIRDLSLESQNRITNFNIAQRAEVQNAEDVKNATVSAIAEESRVKCNLMRQERIDLDNVERRKVDEEIDQIKDNGMDERRLMREKWESEKSLMEKESRRRIDALEEESRQKINALWDERRDFGRKRARDD